jgi:hypothetical protein
MTKSQSTQTVRRPTLIDTVEIELEGGLHLNVSGFHTEGSGVPVKVETRRTGDHIKVRIYREWDIDAICPAALLPYEDKIPLNEPLSSGQYIIDVNHHFVELNV